MRILVLGGTGVISTGITPPLLDRGDSVTLFNPDFTHAEFGCFLRIELGSRQLASYLKRVAAEGFDAVIDMICWTEEDGRLAMNPFDLGPYLSSSFW